LEILETVEVGPKQGADSAVIWLHGLGADGHDFEPVVPALGLPQDRVRFVFPHAPQRPVTINNGFRMRAWYDIVDLSGERQDEDGFRDSSRLVENLIRRENDRGVPSNRIVLAGFSQGGAMTLFTGLRYPEKLAGMAALSCYLPMADTVKAELANENLSMPLFMAHGSADPMLPMHLGTQSFEILSSWGMKGEWHDYPMPHSVCPEEIGHIATWLRKTLGF